MAKIVPGMLSPLQNYTILIKDCYNSQLDPLNPPKKKGQLLRAPIF